LFSDPEKMLRFDLSLHNNTFCSGKQVYLEIGEDNKMCQSSPIDAKVENISEDSLDLIPSLSPSVNFKLLVGKFA
jgi:hypothetical protein